MPPFTLVGSTFNSIVPSFALAATFDGEAVTPAGKPVTLPQVQTLVDELGAS